MKRGTYMFPEPVVPCLQVSSSRRDLLVLREVVGTLIVLVHSREQSHFFWLGTVGNLDDLLDKPFER